MSSTALGATNKTENGIMFKSNAMKNSTMKN